MISGHLLRSLCKMGRRADVARPVTQILGEHHALCDCEPLLQCFLCRSQFVSALDGESEFAQGAANFVLLALELVKAIGGFLRDDRRLPDSPGNTALLDRDFGEKDGAVESAGFVERFDADAYGLAKLLLAELLFLAEADQQHAVAERSRDVMEQEGGAGLALHVATPDDVGDMVAGGIVEKFSGQAEFSRFEYADDDAGAALLLRTSTFYAKFHWPLL